MAKKKIMDKNRTQMFIFQEDYKMKPIFAMLIVVFVLSACTSRQPALTPTPLPTNTQLPTETAVPSSTPTLTPEPAGTMNDFNYAELGWTKDELTATKNSKGEDVIVIAGGSPDNEKDVLASKDKYGAWERNARATGFYDHIIAIARPMKFVNGAAVFEQDHVNAILKSFGNKQYVLPLEKHLDRDSSKLGTWLFFAPDEQSKNLIETKKPMSGRLYFELPSGELVRFNIYNFVNSTFSD